MTRRNETITIDCSDCGISWSRERGVGALPKRCSDCHVLARRASSYKWRAANLDRRSEYQRRHNLRRHYGLTVEEFEAMFDAQGRVCAICKGTDPAGRNWCVDHSHETGAVRGVLCNHCNRGLGMFADDTERIFAAIQYLKDFRRSIA